MSVCWTSWKRRDVRWDVAGPNRNASSQPAAFQLKFPGEAPVGPAASGTGAPEAFSAGAAKQRSVGKRASLLVPFSPPGLARGRRPRIPRATSPLPGQSHREARAVETKRQSRTPSTAGSLRKRGEGLLNDSAFYPKAARGESAPLPLTCGSPTARFRSTTAFTSSSEP